MSHPSSPGQRRGGGWQRWLTLAIGLLALGGTVWVVGAGSLWQRLRGLDGRWVAVGLGITGLQFLLMAARWWFLARRLGVAFGYGRALGEYYLSVLLNSVLPLGVVGDGFRAFRLADHAAPANGKRPVAAAVLTVVVERASGQVALYLAILAGAPAWWPAFSALIKGGSWLRQILAVLALAATLVAIGFLSRHRLRRLSQAMATGVRVFFARSTFLVHLSLSLVMVLTHLALFMTSARALGLELGLNTAIVIVPPSLAASTFVSIVGGFGTREAAVAALFHMAGLDVASGVAISFVYGAISLLGCLPGLLALPWRRRDTAP